MSTDLGPLRGRIKRTRAGLVGLVAVTAIAASQAAIAAPMDKVDMLAGATLDGATPQPIPGAFSILDRADEGIATKVRTRARPGHAHTLWYAIFNAPENCSDGVCGDDDVFVDPSDHSAGFNVAQIQATQGLCGLGGRRSGGQPGGTPEAGRVSGQG
jgi:hypothetical protein